MIYPLKSSGNLHGSELTYSTYISNKFNVCLEYKRSLCFYWDFQKPVYSHTAPGKHKWFFYLISKLPVLRFYQHVCTYICSRGMCACTRVLILDWIGHPKSSYCGRRVWLLNRTQIERIADFWKYYVIWRLKVGSKISANFVYANIANTFEIRSNYFISFPHLSFNLSI